MPRQVPDEAIGMELTAIATELGRLAEDLCTYDGRENRAHIALSHNGQNAAQVIAALIEGDKTEAALLRVVRARAASLRAQSRALTARLAGVGEAPDPEIAIELWPVSA